MENPRCEQPELENHGAIYI